MSTPPTLFISAGEASGDLHAAALIRALRQSHPDLRIVAIAGPAMLEAGCEPLAAMSELNVMGIGDVLAAYPRIKKLADRVLDELTTLRPAVAVLVDFPGFHLRLGEKLRARGIPVIQYIAPKLWAWGTWRVPRLKRAQDQLASILPFETEWFARHNITARYVGNPSAAASASGWSRAEFFAQTGLNENQPIVALLPGSRPSEIRRHLPLLADCWQQLRVQHPHLQAVVPVAPGVNHSALAPLITQPSVVTLNRLQPGYRLYATAAVAVSGTATLELALWDIPTVLIYRTSWLTFAIGRRLVALRCGGLANILLGDTPVMPELFQKAATVPNIVQQLNRLLTTHAAADQRAAFVQLRSLLGDDDPSANVARLCTDYLFRPIHQTDD